MSPPNRVTSPELLNTSTKPNRGFNPYDDRITPIPGNYKIQDVTDRDKTYFLETQDLLKVYRVVSKYIHLLDKFH